MARGDRSAQSTHRRRARCDSPPTNTCVCCPTETSVPARRAVWTSLGRSSFYSGRPVRVGKVCHCAVARTSTRHRTATVDEDDESLILAVAAVAGANNGSQFDNQRVVVHSYCFSRLHSRHVLPQCVDQRVVGCCCRSRSPLSHANKQNAHDCVR